MDLITLRCENGMKEQPWLGKSGSSCYVCVKECRRVGAPTRWVCCAHLILEFLRHGRFFLEGVKELKRIATKERPIKNRFECIIEED